MTLTSLIFGMMAVVLGWGVIWQRVIISRDRKTIEQRGEMISELRSQNWERQWDDEERQRWRDFPVFVRSNALDRVERMAREARVFPAPTDFMALVHEMEGYRMEDYPAPEETNR